MKAGTEKLHELLSQGLAQALKEGNVPAHVHCLQAFAAIGDASGAEKVRLVLTWRAPGNLTSACEQEAYLQVIPLPSV